VRARRALAVVAGAVAGHRRKELRQAVQRDVKPVAKRQLVLAVIGQPAQRGVVQAATTQARLAAGAGAAAATAAATAHLEEVGETIDVGAACVGSGARALRVKGVKRARGVLGVAVEDALT
jgi:hypothetical protein